MSKRASSVVWALLTGACSLPLTDTRCDAGSCGAFTGGKAADAAASGADLPDADVLQADALDADALDAALTSSAPRAQSTHESSNSRSEVGATSGARLSGESLDSSLESAQTSGDGDRTSSWGAESAIITRDQSRGYVDSLGSSATWHSASLDASVDASRIDATSEPGELEVHDSGVDSANPSHDPACAELRGTGYEPIETRCDGIDNDCDGAVDVLLPVDQNSCTAPNDGCTRTHAACWGQQRVCAPAPVQPEVFDGRDNDCNGAIDDVDDAELDVPSTVLLLVPAYVQEESPEEVDNVSSILDQRGIAHHRSASGRTFDEMLEHIGDYPLVIVVGYLVDEYLSPHRREALEQYAAGGGTLVVTNPVFASGADAHSLIGTQGTVRRDDVAAMRWEASTLGVTAAFDSPEERTVPLDNHFSPDAPRLVNVLMPADGQAQTVASALVDGQSVGAIVTRRPVGRGFVYALGHHLIRFHHGRCYINCFEPSGDMGGLFLRELLREATRGHLVTKHTVPGPEDGLLSLTHDVDGHDAQHPGEWGAPGALQVAQLERSHQARGSFFFTTGDAAGPLSSSLIRELCDLGMCPTGAHSVLHGSDFGVLPLGTCTETQADYHPDVAPTLCGEVRVSMEMLESSTGTAPRAWRSPFLIVNPEQYDVLDANGVVFDSSYAVGDLKFNLPLSLARTGIFQHVFRRRQMYSMPIALEDGMAEEVNGVVVRRELSAENVEAFVGTWVNTLLRNADNHAHTMALMHPSFGWDVPVDNLRHKLRVLEAMLRVAAMRGIKVDVTVDEVADFWRAREELRVNARYAGGQYGGTLEVGGFTAPNLTLEFGDEIRAFDCDSCGSVQIAGKRVVLRDAPSPESVHHFRARVRD